MFGVAREGVHDAGLVFHTAAEAVWAALEPAMLGRIAERVRRNAKKAIASKPAASTASKGSKLLAGEQPGLPHIPGSLQGRRDAKGRVACGWRAETPPVLVR